jgi:hypothetical protein
LTQSSEKSSLLQVALGKRVKIWGKKKKRGREVEGNHIELPARAALGIVASLGALMPQERDN